MYTTSLAKTTCKAEQRRLLQKGPPINISDARALECPDGGEVHSLWYCSDGLEHSAKLEGSFEGEVRTLLSSSCLQLPSIFSISDSMQSTYALNMFTMSLFDAILILESFRELSTSA